MRLLNKLVLLSLAWAASGATAVWADTPSIIIVVTNAWTPAQLQAGGDTPLYMTIDNHADAEDAVVRASCPVANFVELRVLDQGEGVPAERPVKRITVPAGGLLKLTPEGARIALLQTTQVLAPGQHFSCRVTFKNAGPLEVDFRVGGSESIPSG